MSNKQWRHIVYKSVLLCELGVVCNITIYMSMTVVNYFGDIHKGQFLVRSITIWKLKRNKLTS